jgi:hypothetical protein
MKRKMTRFAFGMKCVFFASSGFSIAEGAAVLGWASIAFKARYPKPPAELWRSWRRENGVFMVLAEIHELIRREQGLAEQ